MARLPLKPTTIKRLFAKSGNICAFPGCDNAIVNKEGTVIGEICHIEGAEELGERYNPHSTDEERRSYENLILLCRNHHTETNDVAKYPVAVLRKMKLKHEAKHLNGQPKAENNIVSALIKSFNTKNMGSDNQFNIAHNQNIKHQIGTQHIHKYSTKDENAKPKIEGTRKVLTELKKIIDEFRVVASPPATTVIDFRNEMNDRTERPVELVPVKFLKYRKDNGRIIGEVESYEKTHNCKLQEHSDVTQEILRNMLKNNKTEDNAVLKRLIKQKGQIHPAIITSDGFLINGNRRKLVLEELFAENGQDSKYENMRVVILPERVSEIDIQKIENRYQLQSEGKSEYYGLNRALILRKNQDKGFSLRAQLKDDPNFVDLEGDQFDKAVEKMEKDFLKPLECVDRYLKTFNRTGLYNTISESGDKEGRWQAFVDYSSFYSYALGNANRRFELGIKDEEVGLIENAIFKIIRKRTLNSTELERSLGKVHAFVRGGNLKKYLKNSAAKKHLIKIAKEVAEDIPYKEKFDQDNNPYSEKEIDDRWGNHFKDPILGNLMQAYKVVYNQGERDKPLELLEDALKKLNHNNLRVESMDTGSYDKALELAQKITDRAEVLYTELDKARYNFQKLTKKRK